MYNDNLSREHGKTPMMAIIEVPEEDAYLFNDNWDILFENVTKSGSRAILKQGPVVETIEVAVILTLQSFV